jgi:hypothetical protein
MEEKKDAYGVLLGKPEGKRPLESLRFRWEDNNKWIFMKWNGDMEWINLAQDRGRWRALLNAVMKVWIP